jgi:hypothetical protein
VLFVFFVVIVYTPFGTSAASNPRLTEFNIINILEWPGSVPLRDIRFEMSIETAPGDYFTTMVSVSDVLGRVRFTAASPAAGSRGWVYIVLTPSQAERFKTEGVAAVDQWNNVMDVQVVIRGQFTQDDIIRSGNYFNVTAYPGAAFGYRVFNVPDNDGRVFIHNEYNIDTGSVTHLDLYIWETVGWTHYRSIPFDGAAMPFEVIIDGNAIVRGDGINNLFMFTAANHSGEYAFSFEEPRAADFDIIEIIRSVGKLNYDDDLFALELIGGSGGIDLNNIDISSSYMLLPPQGYWLNSVDLTVRVDGGEPFTLPAAHDRYGAFIDFTQFPGIWSVEIEADASVRSKTFDFEFTKIDIADKTPIPGVMYILHKIDDENAPYMQRSGENGFVSFRNLCVESEYIMREYMSGDPRQTYESYHVRFGELNGEEMVLLNRAPGFGGKTHYLSNIFPSEFSDWVIVGTPTRNDEIFGIINLVVYNADDPDEKLEGVEFSIDLYPTPGRLISPDMFTDINGELTVYGISIHETYRITGTDERFSDMRIIRVNGLPPSRPVEIGSFSLNFTRGAVQTDNLRVITLEVAATPIPPEEY